MLLTSETAEFDSYGSNRWRYSTGNLVCIHPHMRSASKEIKDLVRISDIFSQKHYFKVKIGKVLWENVSPNMFRTVIKSKHEIRMRLCLMFSQKPIHEILSRWQRSVSTSVLDVLKLKSQQSSLRSFGTSVAGIIHVNYLVDQRLLRKLVNSRWKWLAGCADALWTSCCK